MAGRAGSKAGQDRVSFTKASAQRIADAVRAVEGGDRDGIPFVGAPRFGGGDGVRLKVGTFTGNWNTGEWKTVKLVGSTNTADVYNWCVPALGGDTSSTTGERYVVWGKASGTNSVVEIQTRTTQCTATIVLGGVDLSALSGYSEEKIQILGHGIGDTNSTCSAGLQWFDITTCATATSS